jgi:hypothetical protein
MCWMWDNWDLGISKKKIKQKKNTRINNSGHVNLPDELYFDI